jgi:excinuclease UvrABC helicase subunit UvrB
LPLLVSSKNKETNASPYKSIALLEIDLLRLPSTLDNNPVTYEDEFESIVNQNLPIIDPIYSGTIKLPELDDNTLRVLLQIIESNTPLLKESIGMLGFMMFVGS